jgi:Ca2+-binding EF-hand superfamily protein
MLTPLQRMKLTRYFKVYDVDDDGRVGLRDFERVLENVRVLHGLAEGSPRDQILKDAFLQRWDALRDSADTNRDGGVDLTEWLEYWGVVIENDDRYDSEVASIASLLFGLFDTDGDGVIGPDEFCDYYNVYGLSAALARQVFLGLDADCDGAMSLLELMDMVHQFFRGNDRDAPGNRLFGPYE